MKNRINLFKNKKNKEMITLLTAYDYSTAQLLNQSDIDAVLVGDTLGMIFQGNESTLPVTVDEMIYHCRAVKKGAAEKFLIADMPFLSFQISIEEAIRNAGRLIKEGGAEAVKLEGGSEVIDKINGLIAAKIPVMGHLGLTPQSVNVFGGFKVQGKTIENAKKLIEDAILLEKSGVFSIVLEGVPERLAKIITSQINIPTIGIGAGRFVDGQVLVINDIFGNYSDLSPKFAKLFCNAGEEMKKGIDQFINEVKNKDFPADEHVYKIDEEVIKILEDKYNK